MHPISYVSVGLTGPLRIASCTQMTIVLAACPVEAVAFEDLAASREKPA
ncbi:MAG: hypothetical protein WBN02_04520 [Sedimenticolaceae bacterium]